MSQLKVCKDGNITQYMQVKLSVSGKCRENPTSRSMIFTSSLHHHVICFSLLVYSSARAVAEVGGIQQTVWVGPGILAAVAGL